MRRAFLFRYHSGSLYSNDVRYNEFNVQMLPENIRKKVFPNNQVIKDANRSTIMSKAKEHLSKHSIPYEQRRPDMRPLPDFVEKIIPNFSDNNLFEHFRFMGKLASKKWIDLAFAAKKKICTRSEDDDDSKKPSSKDGTDDSSGGSKDSGNEDSITYNISEMPAEWSIEAGWTRYEQSTAKSVLHPDEQVLVFDVESCWALQRYPLFAIAYAPLTLTWYSWTAPTLFNDRIALFAPGHQRLISLGHNLQLIIGHNVSFDRLSVAEEYCIASNSRRFIDTMSLHCAVAGLSSQQRAFWMQESTKGPSEDTPQWVAKSSMNNLADAYKLHCNLHLDKSDLRLLIDTTRQEVQSNHQRILSYCARDVQATARLFSVLWAKYYRHCPNPASHAGMLMMGSMVLPVDQQWSGYVQKTEKMFADFVIDSESELSLLAEQTCQKWSNDLDRVQKDPWLSQMNWQLVPERRSKQGKPIGAEYLFGKPQWYKQIYSSKEGRCRLTHRNQIAPLLLRLKWNDWPVYFDRSHGWCYMVDTRDPRSAEECNGGKELLIKEHVKIFKIPHMVEEGMNVGCLFSKSYVQAIEQGLLTSDNPEHIARIMAGHTKWSFWTGYRERICNQLVVYDDEIGSLHKPQHGCTDEPEEHIEQARNGRRVGIIIPATVPMGTVTRRAVEPTWMTAGNPKRMVAGSEQKAMVRAPPGWLFVGADVDSQELWIASLLGDASFGEHGATAMGWMTLQGSRQDSTDLHSRTARILGMRRDDAKIFTYGRIYGAGMSYAASLLSKFNPKWSQADARLKALELYGQTKGQKDKIYCGGTESFMFNQLERIANQRHAVTPILGCRISDALSCRNASSQVGHAC